MLFPSAVFNVDESVSVPESVVLLLADLATRFGHVVEVEARSPGVLSLSVHGEEATGSVWGGRDFLSVWVVPRGKPFPVALHVPASSLRGLWSCVWGVRRVLRGLETPLLSKSFEVLETLCRKCPLGVEVSYPLIVPYLILVRAKYPPSSPEETGRVMEALQEIGVEDVLMRASTSGAARIIERMVRKLRDVGVRGVEGGRAILLETGDISVGTVLYPDVGVTTRIIEEGVRDRVEVEVAPRFFETYRHSVQIPVTETCRVTALFSDEKDVEKVMDRASALFGGNIAEKLEREMRKMLDRFC